MRKVIEITVAFCVLIGMLGTQVSSTPCALRCDLKQAVARAGDRVMANSPCCPAPAKPAAHGAAGLAMHYGDAPACLSALEAAIPENAAAAEIAGVLHSRAFTRRSLAALFPPLPAGAVVPRLGTKPPAPELLLHPILSLRI